MLTAAEDAMTAVFTFSPGAAPSGSEFSVVVTASKYDEAGDGNMITATAKWVDGDPSVSIFDMGTAQQENLPDGNANVEGDVMTAVFDAAPFDALGNGWTWSATVTESGADIYQCSPDAGSDA